MGAEETGSGTGQADPNGGGLRAVKGANPAANELANGLANGLANAETSTGLSGTLSDDKVSAAKSFESRGEVNASAKVLADEKVSAGANAGTRVGTRVGALVGTHTRRRASANVWVNARATGESFVIDARTGWQSGGTDSGSDAESGEVIAVAINSSAATKASSTGAGWKGPAQLRPERPERG